MILDLDFKPIIVEPEPQPGNDLWLVLGDEYLKKYDYMSRTAAPDWGYLPQTPCIHRFSPRPEPNPTEYRVNVLPLEVEHIRINNYDGEGYRRCWNYLFSDRTAYFNNVGYPKMLYAVMANNVLRGLSVEVFSGRTYLCFETLKPTSLTANLTNATHPWLVQKWDLISGTSRETTTHTSMTPRGLVYNFLVTYEGRGYIPIEFVYKLA